MRTVGIVPAMPESTSSFVTGHMIELCNQGEDGSNRGAEPPLSLSCLIAAAMRTCAHPVKPNRQGGKHEEDCRRRATRRWREPNNVRCALSHLRSCLSIAEVRLRIGKLPLQHTHTNQICCEGRLTRRQRQPPSWRPNNPVAVNNHYGNGVSKGNKPPIARSNVPCCKIDLPVRSGASGLVTLRGTLPSRSALEGLAHLPLLRVQGYHEGVAGTVVSDGAAEW